MSCTDVRFIATTLFKGLFFGIGLMLVVKANLF